MHFLMERDAYGNYPIATVSGTRSPDIGRTCLPLEVADDTLTSRTCSKLIENRIFRPPRDATDETRGRINQDSKSPLSRGTGAGACGHNAARNFTGNYSFDEGPPATEAFKLTSESFVLPRGPTPSRINQPTLHNVERRRHCRRRLVKSFRVSCTATCLQLLRDFQLSS